MFIKILVVAALVGAFIALIHKMYQTTRRQKVNREVRASLDDITRHQQAGMLLTSYMGGLEDGGFNRVVIDALQDAEKKPGWKYVSTRRRQYSHFLHSLPSKFVGENDGAPISTMTIVRFLIGDVNVLASDLFGLTVTRHDKSKDKITIELLEEAAALNQQKADFEGGRPIPPTEYIERMRRQRDTRTQRGMQAISTPSASLDTADSGDEHPDWFGKLPDELGGSSTH